MPAGYKTIDHLPGDQLEIPHPRQGPRIEKLDIAVAGRFRHQAATVRSACGSKTGPGQDTIGAWSV